MLVRGGWRRERLKVQRVRERDLKHMASTHSRLECLDTPSDGSRLHNERERLEAQPRKHTWIYEREREKEHSSAAKRSHIAVCVCVKERERLKHSQESTHRSI